MIEDRNNKPSEIVIIELMISPIIFLVVLGSLIPIIEYPKPITAVKALDKIKIPNNIDFRSDPCWVSNIKLVMMTSIIITTATIANL
ncbi:hypothetical protein [Maribacter forsetii]|uniref:hypothetical protein n=1 Tax=Maribacter forsetii TaxID=444515 RepID=UPI0005625D6B|nr:hypothetical protein [Maribacter forsetii]